MLSRAARAASLVLVAVMVALSLTSCSPTDAGVAPFRSIRGGEAIARCIVKRESGGNPRAISATSDYGLFQINRSAHKRQFESMYGGPFESKALDPTLNGRYARWLYDWYVARGMSGWTPWRGGQYPCF